MAQLTPSEALDLYSKMATSRSIEEQCIAFSGHWYPAVGEEAAVVGVHWCADEDDVLYPHYRGALVVHWMRGRALEDIFLAILSRKEASSAGRHVPPFDGHVDGLVMPYVSVMLGPNLAFGAGTALAFRYRKEPRVALVGFGDGTSGTGDFHETLNMAAMLGVPAVFICQNNQYSISTAATEALSGGSIAGWASRYGMPTDSVDGNDVEAVVSGVRTAIAYSRERSEPYFLELQTYRRTGHFVADPAVYRDAEEVRRAEERDPLDLFVQRLVSEYGIDREEVAGVRQEAERAVKDAAEAAQRRPEFTEADLTTTGVYSRDYS